MERSAQQWLPEDDARMDELLHSYTPVDEIATALGRTVEAVAERLVAREGRRSNEPAPEPAL